MPVDFEKLLLGSLEKFKQAYPTDDEIECKLQELKECTANYIIKGEEFIDPKGNSIRKGFKQSLDIRYKVKGIFWNGRLIMDKATFPEYKSINLTKIKRVIDEAGTIYEGEFRFERLYKGTVRKVSGETYTGEFDIYGRLLNVPYVDPEATLPDPVPEEPPPPPFRLYLSPESDLAPGPDQL